MSLRLFTLLLYWFVNIFLKAFVKGPQCDCTDTQAAGFSLTDIFFQLV